MEISKGVAGLAIAVTIAVLDVGIAAAQRFERLKESVSGITFANVITESDSFNIVHDFYAYNGCGVAVGDVNGDGLVDLLFTGTQVGTRLYINKGGLGFEDRTASLNYPSSSFDNCSGVLLADLDADGDLDIYICRRYRSNLYFVNDGHGSFHEEGKEAGLDIQAMSTMAAPFDYDRDGDLDLYLLNNGEARRQGYWNPGVSDRLLRNDGNGRFTDVSRSAGISDIGYGLSVSIGDLDDDGWPDIYVANDFEERDKLYYNNGDGTFRERATSALQNMSWASMGSDIGDVNGDGLLDVVTLDMLPESHQRRMTQLGGGSIYSPFFDSTQRIHNTYQLNRGNGHFSNVCYLAGMAATDWSWSCLIADFDNNGRNDIFITNGTKRDIGDQDHSYNLQATKNVPPDSYRTMPQSKLQNYMFYNDGALSLRNVAGTMGLGDSIVSNGAAFADLDNDGDLDLVLNNTDTVAFIYRNMTVEDGARDRNYLRLSLKDQPGNTYGIGARVTVHAGAAKLVREHYVTRGYLSSVDPVMHIGLGGITSVDSLVVRWSDGRQSVVRKPGVNTTVVARYAGTTAWSPGPAVHPMMTRQAATLIPFRHRENYYDDFKRERLLPHRFSQNGPGIAAGDLNGDGLVDLVCTGAKYAATQVLLQTPSKTFELQTTSGLEEVTESEDVAALLFDIDNDGDLDLLVVTGGNEFNPDDEELKDRLYLNDGKGHFTQVPNGIPNGTASGSCAAAADFDDDGDLDLFIGGSVVPGMFPQPCRSTLLRNDEGSFVDVTDRLAPGLATVGMTTGAIWTDYDNDGDPDLLVVGLWMAPRLWRNDGKTFTDVTAATALDTLTGWWNCVVPVDVDNDGDMDYVLGNLGLNGRFKVSQAAPMKLVAADFDDNGSIDPLVSYDVDGVQRPQRPRMAVAQHMPVLTRTFTSFRKWSAATMADIVPATLPASTIRLTTSTFQSGILMNDGKRFSFRPLHDMAQISPVYGILAMDIDGDDDMDLILDGNSRGADAEIIGYDAGIGLVLEGDGRGGFTPVRSDSSGFVVPDVGRGSVTMPWGSDSILVITAINGALPTAFTFPMSHIGAVTSPYGWITPGYLTSPTSAVITLPRGRRMRREFPCATVTGSQTLYSPSAGPGVYSVPRSTSSEKARSKQKRGR